MFELVLPPWFEPRRGPPPGAPREPWFSLCENPKFSTHPQWGTGGQFSTNWNGAQGHHSHTSKMVKRAHMGWHTGHSQVPTGTSPRGGCRHCKCQPALQPIPSHNSISLPSDHHVLPQQLQAVSASSAALSLTASSMADVTANLADAAVCT